MILVMIIIITLKMIYLKKTNGKTTDPRLRVVDAALAVAVERKRSDAVIDVLLDIRNNVLRDMAREHESST